MEDFSAEGFGGAFGLGEGEDEDEVGLAELRANLAEVEDALCHEPNNAEWIALRDQLRQLVR